MNEENILVNEIKSLRYINLSFLVVIIVSIYLNFNGLNEYYFIHKILYDLFKYLLILLIIFIIIQILLLILVPIFKNNLKVIKFLRNLTFTLIPISLITGLLINISIWKTATQAKTFTRNCPYHFTPSQLNDIMNEYSKKDNNKKYKFCEIRTCIYYNEVDSNNLPYKYICNYDSSQDFNDKNDDNIQYKRKNSKGNEIKSDVYITCMERMIISVSDEIIKNYLNMCDSYLFYICELFEKPLKIDYTSVNNKNTCPNKSYEKTAYLLGIPFFLVDIICFFFLFLIEFIILRKIELLTQSLSNNNNNHNIENNSTINSTIKNNNRNNNNNNNNDEREEEIKKQPTEIIIIGDNNIVNENNNSIIGIERTDNNNIIINTTSKDKENNKNKKNNLKLLDINVFNNDKKNIINNDIINDEININKIQINNKDKNTKEKNNTNQPTINSSSDGNNMSPIRLPTNDNKNKKQGRINLNIITALESEQELKENMDEEEDEKDNNKKK